MNAIEHKSENSVKNILVLIFVAVIVTIASVEVMLRLTIDYLPETMQINLKTLQGAIERENMRLPDDYTGNKFKPNYNMFINYPEYRHLEHTNSLIFDDVGFVDDGINGSVYGVVVGDSFTEGVGVGLQDKWVEILEKNTGKDFVNMGFGAFSATQATRVFDKWGTKLHPKIVIYQFNPTDLVEDIQFKEWLDAGRPGYYREFDSRKKPFFELRRFISNNFISYRMVSLFSKTNKDQFIYRDNNIKISLRRNADFSTNDYERGFEIAKNSILSMKKTAENSGTKLIIILIPLREQLYYGLESSEKDKVFWPNQAMMKLCKENFIECYDTTQDFDAYKNDQIYFVYDGHFNKFGYNLLANFTQKFLEQKTLTNLTS